MFTGIIEELGSVVEIEQLTESSRVRIAGPLVRSDLKQGDSVAVSGVCLTAAEVTADGFIADVMLETLNSSSLSGLKAGDFVNLERAMSSSSRYGGHIVQGHVDGVARIISISPSENWVVVKVEIPSELTKYVVHKGSITLDGVSLTVHQIDGNEITLSLIPETLRLTTFGKKQVGDKLNVEADILAKHIEKLIEARSQL